MLSSNSLNINVVGPPYFKLNQTHQKKTKKNANIKDMYKFIKHLWHMLYQSSFFRTKIKLKFKK